MDIDDLTHEEKELANKLKLEHQRKKALSIIKSINQEHPEAIKEAIDTTIKVRKNIFNIIIVSIISVAFIGIALFFYFKPDNENTGDEAKNISINKPAIETAISDTVQVYIFSSTILTSKSIDWMQQLFGKDYAFEIVSQNSKIYLSNFSNSKLTQLSSSASDADFEQVKQSFSDMAKQIEESNKLKNIVIIGNIKDLKKESELFDTTTKMTLENNTHKYRLIIIENGYAGDFHKAFIDWSNDKKINKIIIGE